MATVRKVWLYSNRRALVLGAVPVALVFAGSLVWAVVASGWMRWTAVGLSVVAGYLVGLSIYLLFRPRLAYSDGHLLVYLRPGPAIRLPIGVVECFFLGQGPSLLARPIRSDSDLEEASAIIVRLAETAEQWKHVEVTPAQGLWCDGYITVRGTWCEPINGEVLQRLNHLLVEAHREIRNANQTRQEVG